MARNEKTPCPFCANWDVNKDCPEVEKGKRRVATDSVEGRCSVLLRQTDRHGGPVGGESGEPTQKRSRFMCFLFCFNSGCRCDSSFRCASKVGPFVTLAEEIEGEHIVPRVVSLKGHRMHTHTQAFTYDCFMVMLAIAFPLFPSIHYKRKSTKYLLHCPSTPHPSTMQGQNHSDLDFYIYVYMYTTVCLWGCWIRGRVKSLHWVISFFSIDRLSTHKCMILKRKGGGGRLPHLGPKF